MRATMEVTFGVRCEGDGGTASDAAPPSRTVKALTHFHLCSAGQYGWRPSCEICVWCPPEREIVSTPADPSAREAR